MRFKDIFINLKIYGQRTQQWVSVINTGMILLIFFKSYETDKLLSLIIFITSLILVFLLGYFDVKHGMMKKEIDIYAEANSVLNRIEKKIDKLKGE